MARLDKAIANWPEREGKPQPYYTYYSAYDPTAHRLSREAVRILYAYRADRSATLDHLVTLRKWTLLAVGVVLFGSIAAYALAFKPRRNHPGAVPGPPRRGRPAKLETARGGQPMFGSRVLVALEVCFFGENEASVVLDTTRSRNPDEHVALLVPLYWARMMFNLANSQPAYDLGELIGETAQRVVPGEGKVSRFRFLPEGFQLSHDVLRRPSKTYRATLEQKRNGTFICQTRPGWGEELHYAPMSVAALFQHVVDTLSEDYLAWTSAALLMMASNYMSGGSWTRFADMNGVPAIAFDCGTQYLTERGYASHLARIAGAAQD